VTAYVQTSTGQLVEGPEADLEAYIAANPGAKQVTPDQATEIARVNAVRESQTGAVPAAVQAVESGIRGVAFGLPIGEAIERAGSGLIGFATGGVEGAKQAQAQAAERIKLRAEENKGIDLAAEAAGFGASLIASAGTKALAEAPARAAAAAAGRAAEAGAAKTALGFGARALEAAGAKGISIAEGIAEKTGSELAQRAVQTRIGQAVARGIGEASGLAVTTAAKDVTLNDQLSAEYIASHLSDGSLALEAGRRAGEAVLVGAGAGALFTGLGAAARSLRVGGVAGGTLGGIIGGVTAGPAGAAAGAAAGAYAGRRASLMSEEVRRLASLSVGEAETRAAAEAAAAAQKPKPGSPLTPDEIAAARNVPKTIEEQQAYLEQLHANPPPATASLEEREAYTKQIAEAADNITSANMGAVQDRFAEIEKTAKALQDPESPQGRMVREQLATAKEGKERVAGSIVSDLNDFFEGARASHVTSTGKSKAATLESFAEVDALDGAAVKAASLEHLTQIQNALDEALEHEGISEAKGAINKLSRRLEQEYDAISKMGNEAIDAGHMAARIDDLKREIGNYAVRGFGRMANAADKFAEETLKTRAYEPMRQFLQSPEVFGTQIAEAQRMGNAAWTDYLTNSKRFQKFTTAADRDIFDPFKERTVAETKVVPGFVRDIGSLENQLDARIFKETVQNGVTLMETMQRLYKPGVHADRIASGIASGKRILASLEEAQGFYNAEKAAELLQTDAVSKFIGQAQGAIPMVGKLVEQFADVQKRVIMMQATERVVARSESRMNAAVAKFLAGGARPGQLVAEAAALKAIPATTRGGRPVPPEPRASAQKPVKATALGEEGVNQAEAVRQMATVMAATQGDNAAKLVADAVTPMASPNDDRLAVTAANAMARAQAFLARKVPPSVANGDPNNAQPQFAAPRLTDSDLAKWKTYVKTVSDPLSVADDLAQGTISREQVETLRVVFPAIYTTMQTKVLEGLRTSKRPIDYDKRVLLFTLFGTAVDPTLKPANIAAVQQTFMPTPKAPNPAFKASGPGGYAGSFAAGLRLPPETRAARRGQP
jgi:hypothetical protein